MRKKQAEHNESLCDLLLQNGNYNDWVVTTAFYSALHFVHYKIFPIVIKDKKYNNLNEYFFKVERPLNNKCSKHNCMIKLVNNKLGLISGYYRWIYDSCMYARYSNYQINISKAQKARNYLKDIKKACI